MRVVHHQNLSRMTPHSKVSLEQTSTMAAQSEQISVKKIQTQLEFTQLFDITPFSQLLEQHRQLQRKLVPEQCVESSVNHPLTRSKASRKSRKSELSETSPSRQVRRHDSRYESSKAKDNRNGACVECSRFEPLAFSECYESKYSDCSCSYCQSDDECNCSQNHRKVYVSHEISNNNKQPIRPQQSAPSQQKTYNYKSSTPKYKESEPVNKPVRTPSLPISTQKPKRSIPVEQKVVTDSLRKHSPHPHRKHSPHPPRKHSPHSQRTPSHHASRKHSPHPLKQNKTKTQEDDILNLLANPINSTKSLENEQLVKQIQLEAQLKQQQVKAALRILEIVQRKVREGDKEYSRSVRSQYTQQIPVVTSFKNKFPQWGINQPKVLEGQKRKEIMKNWEKKEPLPKSEIRQGHREIGYKSKQEICKELQEKRKSTLEKRQNLLHRKYSEQDLSEHERRRIAELQRKRSEEKSAKRQSKIKLKERLKKVEEERKIAIAEMKKKKFKPKKEFVVQPLDPIIEVVPV